MFTINNERPSTIYFKSSASPNSRYYVNYVRVKSNGTTKYIWSNEHTLTLTTNPDASFTVERLSSSYEGTATGTLSTGDKIYLGDSLKVSANLGQSQIFNYFTINSTNYSINPYTFTVGGDTSISLDITNASWHTIFTGSQESTHCTSQFATTYHMNFPGLLPGKQTKVSGYLKKESNTTIQAFNDVTLPYSTNYNSTAQTINEVEYSNELSVTLRRPTPTMTNKPPYFVITKIEQFY